MVCGWFVGAKFRVDAGVRFRVDAFGLRPTSDGSMEMSGPYRRTKRESMSFRSRSGANSAGVGRTMPRGWRGSADLPTHKSDAVSAGACWVRLKRLKRCAVRNPSSSEEDHCCCERGTLRNGTDTVEDATGFWLSAFAGTTPLFSWMSFWLAFFFGGPQMLFAGVM